MSDYPDGIQQVNIVGQGLDEIINRPKYGAATKGYSNASCSAGNTTTLLTISGKGIIYGGSVFVGHVVSHKNDFVSLFVDGNNLGGRTFDTLQKYSFTKDKIEATYIFHYDDVLFKYGIGFLSGITFESGFTLTYYNASANDVSVVTNIIYALI